MRGNIIDNIAKRFSDAADTYDQAAFVEREIGDRLIERLAQIKFEPKVILDLGCGTGYFAGALKKLFPSANIIGLDFATNMIKIARIHYQTVQANALQLPLINSSIDLIFANCTLPHIGKVDALILELTRVLSSNGLLLFTTYGPDTLQELGLANHWQDMHHLGDLMLQIKLKDPVVDSEKIIFTYDKLQDLLIDLQETGAYRITNQQIDNIEKPCIATYEIIYGHAWGKNEKPQAQHSSDTFYIEVSR